MNTEAVKILKSDPEIRTCWMYFEALRRIGFDGDMIYIGHAPNAVWVRAQDQDFIIVVGPTPHDKTEWARRWGVVATEISEGKVPESVLMKIWSRTEFGADATGPQVFLNLILSLQRKGFIVSIPPRYEEVIGVDPWRHMN